MANVTINDLPPIALPINQGTTFVEVEANVGAQQVSRKMSLAQVTGITVGVIQGTSIDNPANPGGVFDAFIEYQQANDLVTGRVGFNPAGDDFVIQNFAEGGGLQLRLRDTAIGGVDLQPGSISGNIVNGTDAGGILITPTFTSQTVTDGTDTSAIQVLAVSIGLTIPATGSLLVNGDPGAATEVLTSNGPGVAPTWEPGGGGGGGQVNTVVGGVNVTVDSADPVNPIINLDAALVGVSVNGVTLETGGPATAYLDQTGNYSVPAGGGGGLPAGNLGDIAYISTAPSTYTATNAISIADASTPTIVVRDEGIEVVGTAAGFEQTTFSMFGSDGTTLGLLLRTFVTFQSSDLFSALEGGNFAISTTETGGGSNANLNLLADGGVELAHLGNVTFETTVQGALVEGIVNQNTVFQITGNNSPGQSSDLIVDMASNGVLLRVLGVNDARLTSFIQTGVGGAEEDVIMTFTYDGGIEFRFNDVAMARTVIAGSGGLEVNNTVTGAGFERVLTTSDLGGGGGGNVSNTGTPVDNQIAVWTTDTVIEGTTGLVYTGAALNIGGTVLDLNAGADSITLMRARNTVGGISLQVDNTTGLMRLSQTDAAGVNENILIAFARNGAVGIRNNGVEVVAVFANGISVTGGAGAEAVLDTIADTGETSNVGIRADGGGLRARVLTSGLASIVQTNAAGAVQDTWVEFTRDGQVEISHNNTGMARTATAANGGLEVNNTVTGAGYERVLTTSDLSGGGITLRAILAAQATSVNTTLATLTGFSVALLAGVRYRFKLTLWVTSNAAGVAPGIRLRADFTGTVGSSEGRIIQWRNSGLVVSTRGLPDTTIVTGLEAGTTTDEALTIYEGFIEATTAGTFALQFAQDTTDAGNPTVVAEGSSLEVWSA